KVLNALLLKSLDHFFTAFGSVNVGTGNLRCGDWSGQGRGRSRRSCRRCGIGSSSGSCHSGCLSQFRLFAILGKSIGHAIEVGKLSVELEVSFRIFNGVLQKRILCEDGLIVGASNKGTDFRRLTFGSFDLEAERIESLLLGSVLNERCDR